MARPKNQTGVWLTDEQRKAYLASGGTKCPYCGSDHVEADTTQTDGDTATANANCATCKSEWVDLWALTGIAEADEPT